MKGSEAVGKIEELRERSKERRNYNTFMLLQTW